MKRTPIGVGLAAVAVAVGLWPRGSDVPEVAPEVPIRRVVVPRAAPVAVPETAVAAERAWVASVAPVVADCGLPVDTVCDGERCVSVLGVPPLDGVGGWLAMARTSPSLVLGVVAGELGLPDDAVACRGAIRGLGERTILARADGGGETWCLTDGSDAGRALCDEATGGLGFVEGEDRVVELRAPGGA